MIIDETSGKIAVCGGPDVFIYQPYGILDETLKVRVFSGTWIGRWSICEKGTPGLGLEMINADGRFSL